MMIRLSIETTAIVLPLSYDLKLALINLFEELGEEAEERGNPLLARRAWEQNLKLLCKGVPLAFEHFQWLATKTRLESLPQPPPGKRPGLGLRIKNWFRLKKSSLSRVLEVEFSRSELNLLFANLSKLREAASENNQQDRTTEISDAFSCLAKAGFVAT